MAPVKRKAVADDRPSKKAKSADDKEDVKEQKPRKSQDGEKREPKSALKSILQQEERAFPRGGAGVLTPIERKQIQAQAERDVLIEEEGGVANAADEDGELFDEEAAAPAKKKQKKKRDGEKGDKKVKITEVRKEGLSYKNLVVGSSVLGRVTAITGRDVALALPNNLTGFAPILSVSERLTSRIERVLASDEKPEDEDDEDVDLKQLFYVGQWLRASITAMGTEPKDGSKSKKHIELSLDPVSVNGALGEENVVPNSTVQAAVRSVEDHGIVMDLGLSDNTVKGFVSKKALGSAYSLDQVQEGQVMLCLVTGKASNGKVINLTLDPSKFSIAAREGKDKDKLPLVGEAPSVDAFLPGTAVDVLVTETGPKGIAGKIMGMLDVTSDVVHSGASSVTDMNKKHKVGSKVKARVIFSIPQDDGARKVGVSLLSQLVGLTPPTSKLGVAASSKTKTEANELSQPLAPSSIVDDAKVTSVVADRGIFMDLTDGRKAYAHISQLSDSKTDSISTTGPFKPESTHKARILSYNPVDNIYYVSLKKSILGQTFLRLEDLPVGDIVTGTVDKLILGGKSGVTGVLVKLSDSITGLVPEMHLSDAHLSHPERKFREGLPLKGRILSVDTEKRHVRVTLKKSLVEDSATVWKDYSGLQPGMESKGTIVSLLPHGAAVQFYGPVRAWLPVAEMSETFIEKPEKHFRLGQTVTVKVLSVSPETQEMKVTCKDSSTFDDEQQTAWDEASGGQLVSATVSEKLADSIAVDLDSGIRGTIRIGHVLDGSASKAEKELKRIRVGQKLTNLLVLNKQDRSHTVVLSNKPSMVEDTKTGALIKSFADARQGKRVHGFVRNITPEGVYVEFANGVVGLVPKTQILADLLTQPSFGLRKDQTVVAYVTGTDDIHERFILSMREQAATNGLATKVKPAAVEQAGNPVDTSISSLADITLGRVVKARIVSIKATQINVRLADNVRGRIDVSEAFDSWDEITNKAAPLQKFKQNEIVDVKVLGIHDARNHRFLPISHRQGKVPVFELSAKKSRVDAWDESLLGLDSVKPGSTHLAFVNNHGDNCVWVNLSPNVRGRVALMDLSDDVGQLQNVENRFRVGCALRVKVKSVDVSANRLDLTARQNETSEVKTLKDLRAGMVIPARVTKTTERLVNVQITDTIAGVVPLAELSDDFEQANPAQHNKNDIVRVCVLAVDAPNKKIFLSLRPSKVLSSSLPTKDAQVNDTASLKVGDIVRGFVKQVTDKGVFISLGATVDALVRISDLNDRFVKNWKSLHEIDQLVKGRILSIDNATKQVQMSLKQSHVDGNYTPPLSIDDLKAGDTVTGRVRKVEDFGAFVDIDNTQPRLSGLCHRSEVAARRVEDVRKLYSTGDVVKAKVLSVDVENRKISLGLKASYFDDEDEEEDEEESEDDNVEMDLGETGGVEVEEESDAEGGVNLDDVQDMDSDEDDAADGMEIDDEPAAKSTGGLKTNGFDWNGDVLDTNTNGAGYESEPDTTATKKRKRNKPEIKEDLTGDLDKYGPRSVSDFERQLLGQPNNSSLWIQYMAFQIQLSELDEARKIAERALRTIHIRETEEKLNVWVAWLNLEVEYGDEEHVDEVFKEACQVQDSLEMHEKLASIYISSGQLEKADNIYERMIGNKNFRAVPDVWLNYATFLMNDKHAAERARALLPKAMQSIPMPKHRDLTADFAALEFKTKHGDAERGRTIFENILAEWPKWSAGWDRFLDLERSRVSRAKDDAEKKDAIDKTRALFGRVAALKMKKRRAKFVFKKWFEFEEKEGSEKEMERVKVLAKECHERLAAKGEEADEE
ncbi:rRNA biogenesis protein rrp5 [Fulvia fulva]|nr:rRNA biogenesis protein rrp5 [Fulvia fulva]